jgi:hypothetical protein
VPSFKVGTRSLLNSETSQDGYRRNDAVWLFYGIESRFHSVTIDINKESEPLSLKISYDI